MNTLTYLLIASVMKKRSFTAWLLVSILLNLSSSLVTLRANKLECLLLANFKEMLFICDEEKKIQNIDF